MMQMTLRTAQAKDHDITKLQLPKASQNILTHIAENRGKGWHLRTLSKKLQAEVYFKEMGPVFLSD